MIEKNKKLIATLISIALLTGIYYGIKQEDRLGVSPYEEKFGEMEEDLEKDKKGFGRVRR